MTRYFRLAALLGAMAIVSTAQTPFSSSLFNQMRHRYIGPVGNRVIAAVSVPGDTNIYYAGTASGGIFKSSDAGTHWDPIFDGQEVSSIGALAIAATDPNLIWAGTGESFIRSHISMGAGVFKSGDAGKTWQLMGLEKTGRISRMVVDPRNSDVVLACALGHAYGPQLERGVFRTADGGRSWQHVLRVDDNTGCSDMIMDPNNSRILFAGMWQLEMSTWTRTSGGPGSGVFKSTDGGVTWRRLTAHGLPTLPVGKIGLAMSRKNSDRVYALIETGDGVPWNGKPTENGQLWSSDDAGENWRIASIDRQLRGRTAYYTRVTAEPDNENELYFLSAAFSHSLDGGRTLTDLPALPGGDNHDIWIDPTNGDRMAVANDSGFSISVNRGKTWNRVQLPIAQLYHVTLDTQIPYFVYGNKQDGSSYRGPGNSLAGSGRGGGVPPIPRSAWHEVTGGESGFATPDPVDPNIIWSTASGSGSVGGIVTVFDERNRQARNVEIWPEQASGSTAAGQKYRFNWEFPIFISPHNHNRVYAASQFVHVTSDGGNSWQNVSPDLTKNEKDKQGFSGGLTGDNIGVEYANVIFALAESPKEKGLLWAGTNDGLVQMSRDDGKTWNNVTANISGMPSYGTVSNIEPSRYEAGAAYISVDTHQVNDFAPYLFRTTDYGKTWSKIVNGIKPSMLSYTHCIREDPHRKGLLYAGTENGLYVSFDDGGNWQPLQMNLPHAPVYWIALQEHFHDLAVATYGRGFWILDDLTPLEQMTPQVAAGAAHLFTPRDAYRFRTTVQQESMPYDPTAGQNLPYGASLNYYLKTAPQGDVRIAILDATGKIVRNMPGTKTAGVNRLYWDLRGNPTRQIRLRTPPDFAPEITVGPEGFRPMPGDRAITLLMKPGVYTVRLSVDGKDYTQNLNVLKDPHSNGTEGTIDTQGRLMTSLYDTMNSLAEQINQMESVRAQLLALKLQLPGDANTAVRTAADQLEAKLKEVEENLFQMKATGRGQDGVRWPNQLVEKVGYLSGEVEGSDYAPTVQQTQVHGELKERTATWRQRMTLLMQNDVAAFNAMLRQRNVPNVVVAGQ